MREIKFRAKRVDNGEWAYGDLHIRCFKPHIHTKPIESIVGLKLNIQPNTIGQFSGLHDKNGKEIYEGDILMCIGQRADNKGRKYYRKVLFDNGSFCMTVPEYKMLSPLRDHVVDGKLGWEVIGNIYDNPELIKKEE